jgi:hypothetical protein
MASSACESRFRIGLRRSTPLCEQACWRRRSAMTTGRLRPPLQFYAGGVIAPSKANERRIEVTIVLEMLSPPDRRFSASLRNRSARAGHTSPKVLPPSLEGVHHLYHHHPRDCRTIPEITSPAPFSSCMAKARKFHRDNSVVPLSQRLVPLPQVGQVGGSMEFRPPRAHPHLLCNRFQQILRKRVEFPLRVPHAMAAFCLALHARDTRVML